MKEELDRDGIVTRAFTSASNRSWGARPFSLGHLRLILTNPIYCGAIAHKGERFKAQHPPIIAAETFAAVQQRLASSRRESRIRATATEANLLSRLLFDADGRPLVGDHGKKASRRYRYYVSKPDSAEALRIPAGEIEPLVLQALATHLCDRSWLMDTLLPAGASPELIEYLGREAATLAAELQHLTPSRQCAALQTIVERITIRRDRLAIALKPDPFGLVSMGNDAERDAAESDAPAVIDVPARFVKRGQQLHLVVPPRDGEDPSIRLDKPLIKALARAVT